MTSDPISNTSRPSRRFVQPSATQTLPNLRPPPIFSTSTCTRNPTDPDTILHHHEVAPRPNSHTMSTKPSSRWTDPPEDSALTAKRKHNREEKKRLKAEKARKLQEQEAAAAAAACQKQQQDEADARPAKRRKTTPPPGSADTGETSAPPAKLLRFSAPPVRPCRNVDVYDKLNDIEEGAYGWVARAKEKATGEIVALKKLKIDPADRGGLPVTGLREIQILKDCSHRNIVRLREVVRGEKIGKSESIFLVLDFLEHDLKSILTTMPHPFLSSEVKTLLHQLTTGLHYLHTHHILHRDLKTSNLLLSNRGTLKIADFGMSRYIGTPPPPNLTQLVVTLWYRAPELLLGETHYGTPIDLWSVGCIFAELLSTEPLFEGKNEVDALTRIFSTLGLPTEDSWPSFRRLPHARSLKIPPRPSSSSTGSTLRTKFPLLTNAGVSLLNGLLSLDPAKRPTAGGVLSHEYFRQDPRPKQESMFPTFPSKGALEGRRKRDTPDAPGRGQVGGLEMGAVDFSGIFGKAEGGGMRGGGFQLRVG